MEHSYSPGYGRNWGDVFEFGNFFSAGGMNQFFSEAALVDRKIVDRCSLNRATILEPDEK